MTTSSRPMRIKLINSPGSCRLLLQIHRNGTANLYKNLKCDYPFKIHNDMSWDFRNSVSVTAHNSAEMSHFSSTYVFTHMSLSYGNARSNEVEKSGVKQFKALIKKSKDPYLALLTYRSTYLTNGLNTAELCMGCRLRTTLSFAPHTINAKQNPNIQHKEEGYRENIELITTV